MKETLFMRQLGAYFEDFLPVNQKRSKHTISAYSHSFALFFKFLHETKNMPHYLVDYKHLTVQLFDEFLAWLEKERNCSAATKRARMSAITSFLKYASRREMAALKACNAAMVVGLPRVAHNSFPYFTVEEIRIILNLPDARTRLGGRDLMLLSLLYDSAAALFNESKYSPHSFRHSKIRAKPGERSRPESMLIIHEELQQRIFRSPENRRDDMFR